MLGEPSSQLQQSFSENTTPVPALSGTNLKDNLIA